MTVHDSYFDRIIEATLGVESASRIIDVPLADVEGLDSLNLLVLIVEAEDRQGRIMPPELIAELRTLRDIVAFANG